MISIEHPRFTSVRPAFEWCGKQFGPVNPRNTRWYYYNRVFFFRDQADAVMFALRWS
jgi:hypothetical protein